MKIINFILMLIGGIIGAFVGGMIVKWINLYEFLCLGPVIVAGAGGGAAALIGRIIQKKGAEKGNLAVVLILATFALLLFKQSEYQSWRNKLIQIASQNNAQFASLSLDTKEQILDNELEEVTGHTGYLSFLLYPRYSLDLEIEIVEGAGFPVHFTFKDTFAIILRFLFLIVEVVAAYSIALVAFGYAYGEK